MHVDVVALDRPDEDGAGHQGVPVLAPVAAAGPQVWCPSAKGSAAHGGPWTMTSRAARPSPSSRSALGRSASRAPHVDAVNVRRLRHVENESVAITRAAGAARTVRRRSPAKIWARARSRGGSAAAAAAGSAPKSRAGERRVGVAGGEGVRERQAVGDADLAEAARRVARRGGGRRRRRARWRRRGARAASASPCAPTRRGGDQTVARTCSRAAAQAPPRLRRAAAASTPALSVAAMPKTNVPGRTPTAGPARPRATTRATARRSRSATRSRRCRPRCRRPPERVRRRHDPRTHRWPLQKIARARARRPPIAHRCSPRAARHATRRRTRTRRRCRTT